MPVDNLPPAQDLTVGSPLFGAPKYAKNMPSPVALKVGSPRFGTPALGFVIAAPAATALVPGSPIFGTPVCDQNPTQLVTGSPIFGTPAIAQVHNLTALPLVTQKPQFGSGVLRQIIQPLIDGIFLPENIERDAKGGPRFNTTIFQGANGLDHRSVNWTRQLCRWSISLGYRLDDDPDYLAVVNMFYTVRGNGFGFLFTDWSDRSAKNQTLGLIANAPGFYQLQKVYTAGAGSYTRKITRPKVGTVVIKLVGVPQTATIDYKSGIVSGIPTGCTASFQFYVPVRFDSDALDVSVERAGLVNIPSIDLVEVPE